MRCGIPIGIVRVSSGVLALKLPLGFFESIFGRECDRMFTSLPRIFGSVLVQEWLENSELLRFLKRVYVKKVINNNNNNNNNKNNAYTCILKGTHLSLLLRITYWLINTYCATGCFQEGFCVCFKTGRRSKRFLWKWPWFSSGEDGEIRI